MSTADLNQIAARMSEQRTAEEADRQEHVRIEEERRQAETWSRKQEQRVLDLIEEVVAELNAQPTGTLLRRDSDQGSGVTYRFGNRTLNVHFFVPGELYENPKVPGRMNTLRDRHAVHGGYIQIRESGKDRQGWNLVLSRPPGAITGEWVIVETDFSAAVLRVAPYRPFATLAGLFADNLACHWSHTTHVYVLKDKPLERDGIVRVLSVFAGQ